LRQKQYYKEDYSLHGFNRDELRDFFLRLGVDVNLEPDAQKEPSINFYDEFGRSEPSLNELKAEVERLRKLNSEMKSKIPSMLNEFREDDPLMLAIQIRNSEWSRYDPENDRATRGNQASIMQSLVERGFTNRQAETIEIVACPIKR